MTSYTYFHVIQLWYWPKWRHTLIIMSYSFDIDLNDVIHLSYIAIDQFFFDECRWLSMNRYFRWFRYSFDIDLNDVIHLSYIAIDQFFSMNVDDFQWIDTSKISIVIDSHRHSSKKTDRWLMLTLIITSYSFDIDLNDVIHLLSRHTALILA